MATAEQLLAGAVDKTLVIDSDLRTIKIPSSITNIGVESDDEVTRLQFRMPRYYNDFDLSEFRVRINYENANREGDVYAVTDAKATDDTITFSWLVGRFATMYKGNVTFIVCLKKLDNQGVVDQEFNTTIATLPVLIGLEIDEEAIVESQTDAIAAAAYEAILLGLDNGLKGDKPVKGVDYFTPEEINEAIETVATGTNGLYANAFKGKASGEVIRVDDVAPVEHPVKNRIHGKNLFDISKVTTTSNITNNGDGTITVNTYYCLSNQKLRELCPQLKAGDVATISFDTQASWSTYIYLAALNGTWNREQYITITDAILDSYVIFYGYQAQQPEYETPVIISNIQIELGETATEYEPYIDPTTVTVTGCGKNLFDYNNVNFIPSSNILVKENNKYVFNNSNITSATYFYSTETTVSALHLKPNTTYTSKAIVTQKKVVNGGSSAGSMGLSMLLQTTAGFNTDAENPKIYIVNGYNSTTSSGGAEGTFELITTFTTPADLSPYIYLSGRVTGGVIVTFDSIQIEEGEISTEYEPFKGGSYTPNPDGTCDVKSVSPYMQIFTNTPGVSIECEYNRDTAEVIASGEKELYMFSMAELKAIINKMGNTMMDPICASVTTLNGFPAVRVTYRLYTATRDNNGNIHPFFDLPIKYNPNPNAQVFERYVKNPYDFCSGYVVINDTFINLNDVLNEQLYNGHMEDIVYSKAYIRANSDTVLGIAHEVVCMFKDENAASMFVTSVSQLTPVITHIGWEYTPTKHKIITPKYLGD